MLEQAEKKFLEDKRKSIEDPVKAFLSLGKPKKDTMADLAKMDEVLNRRMNSLQKNQLEEAKKNVLEMNFNRNRRYSETDRVDDPMGNSNQANLNIARA